MKIHFLAFTFISVIAGCGSTVTGDNKSANDSMTSTNLNDENNTSIMDGLEKATFGAGCFWCVEAIYQNLDGVKKVESGYSGGTVKNPSYKEVCNGTTGHAEVTQITFDPSEISYAELLEVFFEVHDPTTLNRQGGDVGTQYRSVIYYHNDEQKRLAELAKQTANESGDWSDPIVTEISPFSVFYKAEDYHQDYYNLHGEQPYCQMVITPKVDKFKKKFESKLKK